MYGFVLEGIGDVVRNKLGDSKWTDICRHARIPTTTFVDKKIYSETYIPRLVKSASELTDKPIEEILAMCGLGFITYVQQFGYDRLMRVLGRNLSDFLNTLDNLHDYLRFTYGRLKPPSFFIEQESRTGLVLHYRSKRKGFIHYVKGQIESVGKLFYNQDVKMEVIQEDETMGATHVVIKLEFDNSSSQTGGSKASQNLPINYDVLYEVFPFHIVFTTGMLISSIGSGLSIVMPNLVRQSIDEMFVLNRPLIEFNLENLKGHLNNSFELLSVDMVQKSATTATGGAAIHSIDADDPRAINRKLKLKGQMFYMEEWDSFLFLATPIMENLTRMSDTGMYLNDLSMHDSSRDLVLAGTQQQAELKMALDLEKQKSTKLNESMRALDKEMKRTDQLLYQMIPKSVAERLRRGEPAMNTCQLFDSVTILFTDVVGFTSICSRLTPIGVVNMLNGMYVKFDKLTIKHRVYKVETIGDAYMVVSGAPIVTRFHAVYISDMAFDMVDAMAGMPDPSKTDGTSMRIRVGIHTGPVVAGIVGVKMPRYCLIGESVLTANRMESSGSPMRIHISETTRAELVQYPYLVEPGEPFSVSEERSIKTFWMTGKDESSTVKGPLAGMQEDTEVENDDD